MHAVTVSVSIEAGREDDAAKQLQSDVLPRVKAAPGLVSGFWLMPKDGKASSLVVFESEAAAKAMVDGMSAMPPPDFITFDKIEVREIAAQV